MFCVNFDVLFPLIGDILIPKDGLDRASRLASAAIDALIGIDEELFCRLEFRLILARVYTINGADIDTGCVLCANARFANYISSHYAFLLPRYRLDFRVNLIATAESVPLD
jgi:hypothetical protein